MNTNFIFIPRDFHVSRFERLEGGLAKQTAPEKGMSDFIRMPSRQRGMELD